MVNQGCTTSFPTVRFDILEFCHFLEILRAVTWDNKVQIKEEEWPHPPLWQFLNSFLLMAPFVWFYEVNRVSATSTDASEASRGLGEYGHGYFSDTDQHNYWFQSIWNRKWVEKVSKVNICVEKCFLWVNLDSVRIEINMSRDNHIAA